MYTIGRECIAHSGSFEILVSSCRAQKNSPKCPKTFEKGGFQPCCSKLPEDGSWAAQGEIPLGCRRGSGVLPCCWLCASLGWGSFCRAAHVNPHRCGASPAPVGWAVGWSVLPAAVRKRGSFLILWDQWAFHRGKVHSPAGSSGHMFFPPVCRVRCKPAFWMLSEKWIFSCSWSCLWVVDFGKPPNFMTFRVKFEVVTLLVCLADFPLFATLLLVGWSWFSPQKAWKPMVLWIFLTCILKNKFHWSLTPFCCVT